MKELRLPRTVEKALARYTRKLQALYKKNLISVTLYGSAASGEFIDSRSNINLLVVLTDTGLATLARARSLVNAARFRMIHPVFFTEEYIKSSLDVFPIEFLDMKENRFVLYGKDVVSAITIDTKNLRFQCELELKSKLVNIKGHYLAADDRKSHEQLLFRTLTSALHIMRNILRLKGVEPPYRKAEILSEVERCCGVDTTVFSEILWAKSKNMTLTRKEIDALLTGMVRELEAIARVVDTL
jgi:predicted nucleotidyltransferase